MPSEEVCLKIKRGDTWTRTIVVENGQGSRINIDGWEMRFTVKNKISDPDSAAIIKKIVTSFINPTSGEAELVLTPTDTTQEIKSYLFDLQFKTNLGEIFTPLEGFVTITQDVTQDS